ncbi:40S ribosomal protein S27-like isoform X1 [Tyto alba]|uniref:40S ribosomal protein S27-like isoform X1 n=1 Tax=Tyto alba TaxID=56313 RepID=UPI001C6733AF|nr:40S ribosomal protein S27-like isoform X1 [Tyto alba]
MPARGSTVVLAYHKHSGHCKRSPAAFPGQCRFGGARAAAAAERAGGGVPRARTYSLRSVPDRLQLAKDLVHPSLEDEKRKHKKKRLVQSPNSYFMDVKCPGCYKITTVFSHAQTVVLCVGCSTVLCQPTGGKARLTEGCSFRRKQH